MAPNILAAMDARLRAKASNSSLNSNRGQGIQQNGFAHSVRSRASSVMMGGGALTPPTITHHQVLETSEAIKSREQLFDLLNRDNDEAETAADGDLDTDNDTEYDGAFHLGRPKPKFRAGSAMSSKRSSMTMASSAAGGSDIELNTTKRYSGRNGVTAGGVAGAVAGAGVVNAATASSRGSTPSTPADFSASAASARNFDEKEFTEPVLKAEKSAWLKSKSRNSRKWRGICCVVGILALVAVITGITLGFVLGKGKVDGLANPK